MKVGVIMYQTSLTKGQELVAERMVKEFRRQGHEACLITSVYHDQQEVPTADETNRRGYLQSFDEGLGIPLVRVRSHKENWPPRRIAFADFVANLSKIVDELDLDVLITHSTLWNGPEEAAKFVEWRRNKARGGAPVKPLVHCHMSHFQEPTDERYVLDERTFREAWNNTSLQTILRVADLVLVTTPYEKEQMKKMGTEDSKCILFPGGVDSSDWGETTIDIRAKYGIPRGPKLITFLGTIEERKNARALLEVARRLSERSDLHFVIAGKLEGAYGQSVAANAAGMTNVTLTGTVPDEDIGPLIRESYLNINMSRSEALGLAQLEFMHNGVPVVTSGVGGQSWIVSDGSNGVILEGPDDVPGAALSIAKLADSEETRKRLGARARETAAQFAMPELIRGLSQAISAKLKAGAPPEEVCEPGEKVVEAMVRKGGRVVVTTRRLIIDTARGGRAVTVPLAEIVRVSRRREFRLGLLLAGTLGSLGLYTARVMGLPWMGSLQASLSSAFDSHLPGLGEALLLGVVLVPLGLSILGVMLRVRHGYSVVYGAEREAFLPSEFLRALKLADQLTPQQLLTDPV